jgi:hypothetical protein
MQKLKNAALAVVVGALMITSGAAFAQSAPSADSVVSAAIAAVQTSVGTYAGALVGLAAVAVGFFVGIKYIKKIRGAA